MCFFSQTGFELKSYPLHSLFCQISWIFFYSVKFLEFFFFYQIKENYFRWVSQLFMCNNLLIFPNLARLWSSSSKSCSSISTSTRGWKPMGNSIEIGQFHGYSIPRLILETRRSFERQWIMGKSQNSIHHSWKHSPFISCRP